MKRESLVIKGLEEDQGDTPFDRKLRRYLLDNFYFLCKEGENKAIERQIQACGKLWRLQIATKGRERGNRSPALMVQIDKGYGYVATELCKEQHRSRKELKSMFELIYI